jgi:endoglucanase
LFNTAEFNRLHGFVTQATAKGVKVVLDPHNYARYNGKLIGSPEVSLASFRDFWGRLAEIYRTNQNVIFALMNEPHTMSTESWRDAANAALAEIRSRGASNLVLVPGNGWTGAHSWNQNWYGTANSEVMKTIVDPGSNFVFEVHQYLDANSSGTSPNCVSPTIGPERLANFTQWCRQNGYKGFLGEFAGTTNAGCMTALSNIVAYVETNSDVYVGWTYWAAGPWWGNYMFTLEPLSGRDRLQMDLLEQYLPMPDVVLNPGKTNFTFQGLAGLLYQPQSSWQLENPNWLNVGSTITGAANVFVVPYPISAGTQQFLRLNIQRK